MKKSEPILPLPIYDDLFDQQRFNSLCDNECSQQLIFPTTELPNFQFLRDKSLEVATGLTLRRACDDAGANYYKILPKNWHVSDQNFIDAFGDFPGVPGIFDDGVDPPFGGFAPIAKIDCGVLKEAEISPFWSSLDFNQPGKIILTTALFSPNRIHFKIILDIFYRSGGSTFSLKVYDGDEMTGVLISTIASAGVHDIYYTTQNTQLTMVFEDYQVGDKFSISHMQASNFNPLEQPLLNDVSIDFTYLTIKQTENDKDIVTYCDHLTQYPLEAGDYYYILQMGDEIYFSEVFTLKTPKELEKYYRLFWWNSCDINDTIGYGVGTIGCLFTNAIYLDAALFNAEYPTVDDGSENGLGDRNSTFKRWQKTLKLEIPKSPQFLTDALSAVFLHNIVRLKNPLNDKKENPNEEYEVQVVPGEIQDILFNCFQNVKLRLVLIERFTNKNCCDPLALYDCTEDLTPTITSTSSPVSGVFLLEGVVKPGTFAVVEYKLNGGSWTPSGEYTSTLKAGNGSYEVLFDTNQIVGITDLDVRIRSKTLTCDKGTSNEVDLI